MGYGGGRNHQHVLHAGPRRHRHLQDDPGHGQARLRRVLGALQHQNWHSPTSFANMPQGPTANLEGEPSAIAFANSADQRSESGFSLGRNADRYDPAGRPLLPSISLMRRPSR
jgi:hypothetical protein